MHKRGQVTIFIILGIVIVAAFVLIFFLGGISFKDDLSYGEAQVFVNSRVEPFRTFVEDCAEDSAMVVLNTLGRQGGYVVPRAGDYDIVLSSGEDYGVLNYAAFKEDGEYTNVLPSLEKSRDEFERVLRDIALDPDNSDMVFGKCINDFDYFDDAFDDVSYGDLDVDVEFDNKVRLRISFPVTVKRSSYETTIENYFVEIPIDMGEIHAVSSLFVNNAIENDGDMTELISEREDLVFRYIDRDDLLSVGFTNYFTIEAEGYNNPENLLFKLLYKNSGLDEDYEYRFLVGIEE
jgi:hypothetical protein